MHRWRKLKQGENSTENPKIRQTAIKNLNKTNRHGETYKTRGVTLQKLVKTRLLQLYGFRNVMIIIRAISTRNHILTSHLRSLKRLSTPSNLWFMSFLKSSKRLDSSSTRPSSLASLSSKNIHYIKLHSLPY